MASRYESDLKIETLSNPYSHAILEQALGSHGRFVEELLADSRGDYGVMRRMFADMLITDMSLAEGQERQ